MTTNPTSAERSVESVAAGLTKAQRTAVYPGPGNPDYARGRSDTMFALWRKGIIRDLPLRGVALLSELGKSVRAHLTASEKKG